MTLATASILVIARSEATKQSSAAPQNWIASLALAMTNESLLAAPRRPRFATTKPVQETNRSGQEKRGERSAERRIQPCPPCKQADIANPLVRVRGGARRRPRRLRSASAVGARSPSGAP